MTAGTTSGAAHADGAAAGQNVIGAGSSTSTAAQTNNAASTSNNAQFALGLAANHSQSAAAGGSTGLGSATGSFFTIKLNP